jgi:histidine triad (HIT) family protein
LHVHLAPRYPGTPEEYCGAGAVGLRTWADARRGEPSEIDAVGDRIREFLESSR